MAGEYEGFPLVQSFVDSCFSDSLPSTLDSFGFPTNFGLDQYPDTYFYQPSAVDYGGECSSLTSLQPISSMENSAMAIGGNFGRRLEHTAGNQYPGSTFGADRYYSSMLSGSDCFGKPMDLTNKPIGRPLLTSNGNLEQSMLYSMHGSACPNLKNYNLQMEFDGGKAQVPKELLAPAASSSFFLNEEIPSLDHSKYSSGFFGGSLLSNSAVNSKPLVSCAPNVDFKPRTFSTPIKENNAFNNTAFKENVKSSIRRGGRRKKLFPDAYKAMPIDMVGEKRVSKKRKVLDKVEPHNDLGVYPNEILKSIENNENFPNPPAKGKGFFRPNILRKLSNK